MKRLTMQDALICYPNMIDALRCLKPILKGKVTRVIATEDAWDASALYVGGDFDRDFLFQYYFDNVPDEVTDCEVGCTTVFKLEDLGNRPKQIDVTEIAMQIFEEERRVKVSIIEDASDIRVKLTSALSSVTDINMLLIWLNEFILDTYFIFGRGGQTRKIEGTLKRVDPKYADFCKALNNYSDEYICAGPRDINGKLEDILACDRDLIIEFLERSDVPLNARELFLKWYDKGVVE